VAELTHSAIEWTQKKFFFKYKLKVDRILYFGYVVLTSIKHSRKLLDFCKFFGKKHKSSPFRFLFFSFIYYIKYGMHPLDYFYFNVYENLEFNPRDHASTLFMYRFHKKLNDKNYIHFFQNKMLFHKHFKSFMGHEFLNLKAVSLGELKNWIINKKPDSLIIKKIKSVGGFGVKRIRIKITGDNVYINDSILEKKFTYIKKFDLIEEFVQQHEAINRLNQSCLNTVRVVTVLNQYNNVDVVGAAIRLGVNNDVDNFHSGGIAVNVDYETGILMGDGYKLDPTFPNNFKVHPITKIKLDGYPLPLWSMVIETVKKASLIIPQVRTVGWDIAITPTQVSLIEGNHDWDKIIIEKGLKRGIRNDLEKYL